MISIVIATKNRSDFIKRLLSYYLNTGYKHWICIGDSSDPAHLENNRKTIESLKGRLKINYYEYPGLNVVQCHKRLLESIQTPYSACVTDGGFLITSALDKCVNFLNNHPEYSIAHGLGALFELKNEGAHGKFSCLGEYGRLPKVEEATASSRLLHYLNDYGVTMYCVYRTDVWKAIWRDADSIDDGIFAGEVLPGCLTIIYGKAKQLDCLYLVRQIHNQRYLTPEMYKWLTNPGWGRAYQLFHNLLVAALIEQDGVDEKQAAEVVKQAFWANIAKGLNTRFQNRYGNSFRHRLKQRIPWLAHWVHVIKSLLPFSTRLSLLSILNKKSPYYADFMPIYQAVIKQPENSNDMTYKERSVNYVK